MEDSIKKFLKPGPIIHTDWWREAKLYSSASNAKVNYHKTEAFSLSGSNRYIYLSLSIGGPVTILNTLVSSKLWHVLRVLSLPLSLLDKVQSLMSQFLTYRLFPKISLAAMCQPRSSGGLGVSDPQFQQGALQPRSQIASAFDTEACCYYSRWYNAWYEWYHFLAQVECGPNNFENMAINALVLLATDYLSNASMVHLQQIYTKVSKERWTQSTESEGPTLYRR